ncbi:MAG: radical SAM protein [Theionarchaea archaeon]|nr:radical SAM protein [Theionarchaea archaeon]MBU6999358.1 radical SAM protein [Theionarchaea archaeon]MBU7021836.1 radical SAM protein [Theionarchaea archaeon]MBU7035345.1 radical SAM protein [Theionarchaea archaeon]MBU7041067.1 radical SAM protein [Theionarchaea archaeon]
MSFDRILLVKPRGKSGLGFSADVIPIGLEYIASSIEKEVEKVWIVDMELEKLSFEQILDLVQPDLVGITMSATDHHEGLCLAGTARKAGSTTVVGGYHPTAIPDELLSHSQVDIIVRGEGESTMKELVRTDSLEDVSGVSYKKNGKITHNPDRHVVENLDSLPFPARNYRRHKYRDHLDNSGREFDVISMSRGCWGRCIFCCEPYMSNSHMRFRSPENIMKELSEIVSFHQGKKLRILVTDPHFIGDPVRINRLCDLLQEQSLDIMFSVMTRVDGIVRHPELVKKMCDSGILNYEMGFESVSQEDLDNVRKGTTLDMQREAVRILREHGANVSGTFVIGLPGQGTELIKQFPVYAKEIGLMNCAFGIATPFPGTGFYQELETSGLIFERDWTKYDEMHSVFRSTPLTARELERMQSYCTARFWTLNTFLDRASILNKRADEKMSLVQFVHDVVSKAKFARDVGYDLRAHGMKDHMEVFLNALTDAELEENERNMRIHDIIEMSTFLRILGPQLIQLSLMFDGQVVSYVVRTTDRSVEYVRIIRGKEDGSSIGMNFNLDEVTTNSFKVNSLLNPANYVSTFKRIEGERKVLNGFRLCLALTLCLSLSHAREKMLSWNDTLRENEILGKILNGNIPGGEHDE